VNLTATLLNTFAVLRREMTELKSDIARVEARLDAGIAAVRSYIVPVALAVGAGHETAQG